jgi:hypothetical protein
MHLAIKGQSAPAPTCGVAEPCRPHTNYNRPAPTIAGFWNPRRQMFAPSPADSPEASGFAAASRKQQRATSRMYTKGKLELLAACWEAECAWLCHPDLANQLCAKPSTQSSPNHARYLQGQPMPLPKPPNAVIALPCVDRQTTKQLRANSRAGLEGLAFKL